jgi:peptide deformylase
MLLKLIQAGDQKLRIKSKPVPRESIQSRETQEIIDFMIETLRDAPGVGLAAPQVGINQQIIILEDKAKYLENVPKELITEQNRKPFKLQVLINPELEIIESDTCTYFEGCLSVDNYLAAVTRHKQVRVTGLDRSGKKVTINALGWQARILQHEYDHLQGNLYIDNMLSKSFMTTKNFSLNWRKKLEKDITRTFAQ